MTWWRRLINRKRLETDLEKELRFHAEQQAADLTAEGVDPAEARRRTKLDFGGPEQLKEACRDARGTRWVEDFVQDFRYALRALRQQPAFATVALLTLAAGIGATTVMFTLINGVLLKPLAYPNSDRLLTLQEQTDFSTQYGNLWAFTYPNFADCKRAVPSLTMAALRFHGGTVVSDSGESEHVEGRDVSADLFQILGVKIFRGRAFQADDDRPGANPVAIVSYGFWQRRFGRSEKAIGSSITFDSQLYTIAGILPPDFTLLNEQADIFTPLGLNTSPFMSNRNAHRVQVWARIAPGASLSMARNELARVGGHLAEQFPNSNKGRTFIAEPLKVDVSDIRGTLWLLLGAVTLVLLIACANVASLLLARAVSRERELAMRVALGAGRVRLIRQCLTESAVLGLTGGALGVALAAIGIKPFVTFWPGTLPRAEEVTLDWRVLLFALAASLVSGIFFGLAPALRAPVSNLEHALRAGGRSVASTSRRLHSAFVVSQIALALVLLITAGMLGNTLLRLSSMDQGVNIHNVLTARMALSPPVLKDAARIRIAWQDILEQARTVPGVESIAIVDTIPMRDGNNPIGYRTSPAEVPVDRLPLTLANSVTPDYFKVMGIRLVGGRFLDDHDRAGAGSVAVIDEVMARQAFPGEDAIGKHVWIGLGADPARVVGVVAHVRYWGPAGDDQAKVRAQLYYPFAQVPDRLLPRWSELMSIAVRTTVPPENLVESLRRQVRGSAHDQVLYQLNTMEQLAASSIARQRFLMLLFGVFAGLALLLACIGIYGVMAYLTSQRVPEIGVRLALGATARDVLKLVLGQSLGMVLAGVTLGLLAALAARRFLEHAVEGMQPAEVSTLAGTTGVLIFAALLASLIPARRATKVDPVSALRQD